MPAIRTLELATRPVSAAAFATFGRLPADEGTPGDAADLEFRWNDGHLNYIAHTWEEIAHGSRGALCDLLNRHDTHTQALMPVNADAIVVVAPGPLDFSRAEHLGAVTAFLVRRYECFVLDVGTWHWGPFPIEEGGTVRLLNAQGRGYAKDNGIAWLARDHGVQFEVVVAGS